MSNTTGTDKKPTPQPEPPPPLEGLPDAPDWMLWFATVCIILGIVIVLASLAGCAPPPPRVGVVACTPIDGARSTTDTITLDAGMFEDPIIPYIWQGADHPEWATCRYEPPSALCTER